MQGIHLLDVTDWHGPAVVGQQDEQPVAPGKALKYPRVQGKQIVDPLGAAKVPCLQAMHVEAPAQIKMNNENQSRPKQKRKENL